AAAGYGDTTELFLQKCKEPDQNVLIVMLKEDLPQNDFAWWQWLLCGITLAATLITVNVTTFSVSTLTQAQLNAMSMKQMADVALTTVPTAGAIFATVAATEIARRSAAAKYGVELTPPFFFP
ncbi:unnamed protein product, partial [Polarella glacialis]